MTEARDWAGVVGGTWASEWQRTDRSFGDLARQLDQAVLAAAPDTGRALDIGCGAGSTSITLAVARPNLAVTGADLSGALLTVARDRAAHLDNLDFVEGDVVGTAAAIVPINLMISRHGVMFFDAPVAAFAALHRAAAPGARLVFSCFRDAGANRWADDLVAAVTGSPPAPRGTAPGPFAFADAAYVTRILAEAGWSDIRAQPLDFAYRAGEGDDAVADAVSYFSRIGPAAPLLRALSPAAREAALARLAAICADRLVGDAVDFPAAAWLWSAHA